MRLEFGVFITPVGRRSRSAVVELAVLADQVGLDLVTFQDHPYQPRLLDAWTLLSYVAARTSRVRLAPNVLNLPLRPPAVVARAVAALDLLSGGRAELGLGAGAFWDAIEAMGGRRLTPGEGVDALEEAIDVIRALWDGDGPRCTLRGRATTSSRGAAPGRRRAHDVGIWIGAYKPRMLELTGAQGRRLAAEPARTCSRAISRPGNAAIDEAAVGAGRDPAAIRRMLNLPLPRRSASTELVAARASRSGVDTFIVMTDDPARDRGARGRDRAARASAEVARHAAAADRGRRADRLGVTPTPRRRRPPQRHAALGRVDAPASPAPAPDVTYSERGRAVGQHLIDVHDMLRARAGGAARARRPGPRRAR